MSKASSKCETDTLLGESSGDIGQSLEISYNSFFSTRNCIAYAGMVGYFLAYSSRIILSVAINAMVVQIPETNAVNENCPLHHNSTAELIPGHLEKGTFNWTVKEQGYVLSSFFYGSGLTQFPSGIIASKFGGKLSFAIGVVGTGICTFLTPTFAFIGVYELCALRFLMGILQGLVFTSMNHLMGVWVPEFERSFYSALVGGAADIGNIFSPIIAGYLCSLDFMHGWPLIFYLHGLISLGWLSVWWRVASDTPSSHPRILEAEMTYITNNTAQSTTRTPFPWKRALTNGPVLALIVAQSCSNWINIGVMLLLSPYISRVLNYDFSANGIFSCLPWLCSSSMILVFSSLTDLLRKKRIVSTGVARKVNQSVGSFLPAILFILAAHSGCNTSTTILLFTLGMVCFAATFSGYHCNHLDLAPNYAGILFAVCNQFAVLPGIMLPNFVTYYTQNNVHSPELWQNVFYLLGGISSFGGVIYLFFGSGERQKWSYETEIETENEYQVLKLEKS